MAVSLTRSVSFCIGIKFKTKYLKKQESVPVGCVPSAAVAVGGRLFAHWDVSAQGVSAQGGVSARGRGVCVYPSMP